MTFEIDLNGRTRTISIERKGNDKYRVVLDGAPHELDAARVGVYGLSMLVDGEAGVSHDVQVTPGTTRGELLVTLAGRSVPVEVIAVAVEVLGPEVILVCNLGRTGGPEIMIRCSRDFSAEPGQKLLFHYDVSEMQVFDKSTTEALERPKAI